MLPLEVGNSWYTYQDSSIVREVLSLSASVTVPAGSFSDCAHMEDTDTSSTDYSLDSYLHQGVGMVKQVQDDVDGPSVFHIESDLESYTVN